MSAKKRTNADRAKKPRQRVKRSRPLAVEARPVPPVVEGLEPGTASPIIPALWDWPGRILASALNMLEGKKNGGKSSVAAAIAAHVTGCRALPDAPLPPPRAVVWVAGEESWESAVLPRFCAAGGDPAWIFRPHLSGPDGRSRRLTLPSGLPDLADLIRQSRAGLLVIDPFSSMADPEVDFRVPAQARLYLERLGEEMAALGCTVLLTRNCRKGTGGDILDSGLGSSEIGNACRVIMRVDRHPREREVRALSVVASNLGRNPPSLLFRLDPVGHAVRILWAGESDMTAETLSEGRGGAGEELEATDAQTLLRSLLADGEKACSTLFAEAVVAGVTPRALRRAQAELGIKTVRRSTGNSGAGAWYWVPPDKWPDL